MASIKSLPGVTKSVYNCRARPSKPLHTSERQQQTPLLPHQPRQVAPATEACYKPSQQAWPTDNIPLNLTKPGQADETSPCLSGMVPTSTSMDGSPCCTLMVFNAVLDSYVPYHGYHETLGFCVPVYSNDPTTGWTQVDCLQGKYLVYGWEVAQGSCTWTCKVLNEPPLGDSTLTHVGPLPGVDYAPAPKPEVTASSAETPKQAPTTPLAPEELKLQPIKTTTTTTTNQAPSAGQDQGSPAAPTTPPTTALSVAELEADLFNQAALATSKPDCKLPARAMTVAELEAGLLNQAMPAAPKVWSVAEVEASMRASDSGSNGNSPLAPSTPLPGSPRASGNHGPFAAAAPSNGVANNNGCKLLQRLRAAAMERRGGNLLSMLRARASV